MGYDVTVIDYAGERIVSARGRYRISQLKLVVPRELARVVSALLAQGAEPVNGAVAVYHGWTEETVEVELGYTVRGSFSAGAAAGVNESSLPACRALMTTHVGPYERVAGAYEAVMAHAEANSIVLADFMWERYITDPACEPDPDKYVTEIYLPLA